DAEGIDGLAAIDGADDTVHANCAGFRIAGDFGDLRDAGAPTKRNADTLARSRSKRLTPAGLFSSRLDDVTTACDVNRASGTKGELARGTEGGKEEFDRVATGVIGDLVEKA